MHITQPVSNSDGHSRDYPNSIDNYANKCLHGPDMFHNSILRTIINALNQWKC